MKVNEKIKKELIESLIVNKKRINIVYNNLIDKIKKAETVEEIMKLKQRLLIKLIGELPLDSSTCYFCLKSDCDSCEYGKIHGICGYSQSDYMKIHKAKKKFLELIIDLYYSGEKY